MNVIILTINILVLLADFQDEHFSHSRKSLDSLMNLSIEYFERQFPGECDFNCTVTPILNLPENVAYYGDNVITGRDIRPGVLVYQACKAADQYVDFSQFDNDGDGYVDHVIVLAAGGNEAEDGIARHIWPHKWDIYSANRECGQYDKTVLKLDGVNINAYSITSELKHAADDYSLCGIGSICHEMAHSLGMVDMYDTDYEASGGVSKGLLGSISVMDKGNFNDDGNTPPYLSAVELDHVGVGKCDTLKEGTYILAPIGASQKYMKVPSADAGEYYLLECRSSSGPDQYIGGSGVLIYHIDKTDYPAGYSTSRDKVITAHQRWYDYNEVNCRPDYQCAEVVSDCFWREGEGPEFSYRHSNKAKLKISNIEILSDGSARLTVSSLKVKDLELDVFQNSVILNWKSDEKGPCTVKLDGKAMADSLMPYQDNKYAYVIKGLSPRTNYSVAIESKDGDFVQESFTTKPYYKNSYQYIFLTGIERNEDGSFPVGTRLPLVVYGAPYAEYVIWYFNGQRISAAGDGYYHLSSSGKLKAEVKNEDGTVDIIVKELTVK